MKTQKTIILIILLINLFACKNKPEPNLELYNQEAFAFDIGESWEVNASVYAKGFGQIEKNDQWQLKLSYNVDLVAPNSDSLVSIFENVIEESSSEEFTDIQLEAQIEIDSSFSAGEYKLIFNVKDELAINNKSTYINFMLTKD